MEKCITWSSSGGRKSSNLKAIGKTTRTGTKVSFKPDPSLFTEDKGGVSFLHSTLAQRLRELAYLNSGVEITFVDERVSKSETYKFEQGLVEYVKHLNEGKNVLHNVISFEKHDMENRFEVEIALAVQRWVQRDPADLRQQHQQPRRRHPSERF